MPGTSRTTTRVSQTAARLYPTKNKSTPIQIVTNDHQQQLQQEQRTHHHTHHKMLKHVAKSAAWIFSPPSSPERERNKEEARQRQEERLRSTPLFKEQTSTTTGDTPPPGAPTKEKRRSKRTWSGPLSAERVHEMVLGDPANGGQCCHIRCTEKFTTAQEPGVCEGRASYNGDLLRTQQAEFRKLGTETDRKAYVKTHVSPARLAKGSMWAAHSPVCNYAYMRFLGVTSTLISSVEATPKARASPSATRCVDNLC